MMSYILFESCNYPTVLELDLHVYLSTVTASNFSEPCYDKFKIKLFSVIQFEKKEPSTVCY
jgi:hypothetical protein